MQIVLGMSSPWFLPALQIQRGSDRTLSYQSNLLFFFLKHQSLRLFSISFSLMLSELSTRIPYYIPDTSVHHAMAISMALMAVLPLNAFSRTPPMAFSYSLNHRLLPSSIQHLHSLQVNCLDVLLWTDIPVFTKPQDYSHDCRLKLKILSLDHNPLHCDPA